MLQFLARKPTTYWLPRLAIEAFQNRSASGSLAHLLSSFRGEPSVFWLSHKSQRLLDLSVRNQAEERRLLKLHGQSLAQRVVIHRVTGLVIEIREDNRVSVGQCRGMAKVDVSCDRERQHRGGSRKNHLPARDDRGGEWGRHAAGHVHRAGVSFQALKVGANVRRVLVAQIAIFFEAFVDDPFQVRRHIGIQPHWRHRSAVENRLENGPGAFPAKWPRARRHFIDHDAERE